MRAHHFPRRPALHAPCRARPLPAGAAARARAPSSPLELALAQLCDEQLQLADDHDGRRGEREAEAREVRDEEVARAARTIAIGPHVATHARTRSHTHAHTCSHTHVQVRAHSRSHPHTHTTTNVVCARARTRRRGRDHGKCKRTQPKAQARAQASAWGLLGSAGATGNRRQYRKTRARSRPVLTCSSCIGTATRRCNATATQRRRGGEAVATGEPTTHSPRGGARSARTP